MQSCLIFCASFGITPHALLRWLISEGFRTVEIFFSNWQRESCQLPNSRQMMCESRRTCRTPPIYIRSLGREKSNRLRGEADETFLLPIPFCGSGDGADEVDTAKKVHPQAKLDHIGKKLL